MLRRVKAPRGATATTDRARLVAAGCCWRRCATVGRPTSTVTDGKQAGGGDAKPKIRTASFASPRRSSASKLTAAMDGFASTTAESAESAQTAAAAEAAKRRPAPRPDAPPTATGAKAEDLPFAKMNRPREAENDEDETNAASGGGEGSGEQQQPGGLKRPKRYISGFEDHPYYSEQAQVKRNADRGFKRIATDKGTTARRAQYEDNNLHGAKRPDARHARPVEDYREIQDPDPYAGIFKERVSVGRTRLREWRKQFERENEDVELPYERTNALFRAVPNWWVRIFVRIRSKGFADPFYLHVGTGIIVCWGLWFNNLTQVNPRFSKDHSLMG